MFIVTIRIFDFKFTKNAARIEFQAGVRSEVNITKGSENQIVNYYIDHRYLNPE